MTVDELIPGKRYIVKAYHSDPPYPGDRWRPVTEPESKEYTATFVKIERGWTRVKFSYPTSPYYTHYDPDSFAFGEIDIQDLPKDVNDQINEYYGGGVKNTRCKKGGEIKEVAVDDLIPGKRYTIYFRDRDFANRVQAKTRRETFISVERGPRTIIFKDRVPKAEYYANYHRRSYSDLKLEEQEIRSIHEIDIQDLPKDVNDQINEYLGGRKKKRKNKTKKNKSTKKMDKDFKPNLTPRQMFTMGSFGGTYWRPIKSKFHNTTLKNKHKKYSFLKGIPDNLMTRPFDKYDVKLNKYKKKVGTTLKFWENKGWMRESHPYGWVQWYCDYYSGKRSADDARQIKRWQQLAGPNGRFRKWLVTQIMKKGGKDKWDDESISPAIRQTLQHWGYKLTKKDFDKELENRKNKK